MASGAGEEKKSRILVVGATGYIGKHVVAAAARLGHPTTALVRDLSPSDQAKSQLLQSLRDAGVNLLHGDLYDHASLLAAVRDADVVISTLGALQIADQTKLIAAIKEAGNVSRFIPSEFGLDPDHTGAVEPVKSIFAGKAAVRRAVEEAGIPYTYVVSNYFAGYSLPVLGQNLPPAPPVDRVVILGDGKTKVVFVEEDDIGTLTVRAAVDPRAENKAVHIRPAANTVSHEELIAVWEKKTGKKLERVYVPEDAVLKQIQESPIPLNILLSIAHAAYIRGETTTPLDPATDLEATELYPDVKYTTVDEYLDRLLSKST
uniref:NmrA-like domain-containing protein n=1 Tax=Leersia perrieri TaxID=77586 RepID=A0A0D9UVU2_9ORYZ